MPELSFDTPTMAELFVKQGNPQRAAAIYRAVLRDRPDDAQSRQRLSELEAVIASQRGERMNFREHMQRIVESTPGAVACMVMGFDGIAIDSFEIGGAEVDIPTLLIEYGAAAQQLKRAAHEQPAGGSFEEMAVQSSRLSLIFRPLTEEYFIAVVLKTGGLVGKARYLMRLAAPAIAKELV